MAIPAAASNAAKDVVSMPSNPNIAMIRRMRRAMLIPPLAYFARVGSILRRFNLGVPLYYYLMGRRMFGKAMKYPALRLAHFSERFLSKRLYLDLRKDPKFQIPEHVDIPVERARPAIPVLAD